MGSSSSPELLEYLALGWPTSLHLPGCACCRDYLTRTPTGSQVQSPLYRQMLLLLPISCVGKVISLLMKQETSVISFWGVNNIYDITRSLGLIHELTCIEARH